MPKVFLSAGHGGKDPGAVGNGLQEKDINLWIMSACAAYLESQGLSVVCSRTCDEDDPVGEEVREANASGADIAVSFHNNAGGGDGSETWYYTNSEQSRYLANLLESASIALGQNSRGVKATTSLYFLSKTYMNAALVETAFIDNSEDIEIVDTKEKAHVFGVAYGTAICKYFGIEPGNVPEPATPGEDILQIKVRCDLNIRKGPGIEYDITGHINDNYTYTIVDTAKASDGGTWGKLKSGAGWINISPKYVTYV